MQSEWVSTEIAKARKRTFKETQELANMEATEDGYDEAMLLDANASFCQKLPRRSGHRATVLL